MEKRLILSSDQEIENKASRKKLKGHSIPFFKHVLLATY